MKTLNFPNFRQAYLWDCGANALQSVLAYYGIHERAGRLIKTAGTMKQGTLISKMESTIKKYNLKFKSGEMTINEVKKYLDKEIPVILLVQAWPEKKVNLEKSWKSGHYVVAIGYDSKKIYFEDPWAVVRTFLTYDELLKRWHSQDKLGNKHLNWGMAVFGKKPEYDLAKPRHMD